MSLNCAGRGHPRRMIVTLNTRSLCSLDEVRAFLDGTIPVGFVAPAGADRLCWLADTLRQFRYPGLRRPDKRVLLAFLLKVSGLSRAQLTRRITQWRACGRIVDRRGPPTQP